MKTLVESSDSEVRSVMRIEANRASNITIGEMLNEADTRWNEGATHMAVPVSKDRCSKQLINNLCNASQ